MFKNNNNNHRLGRAQSMFSRHSSIGLMEQYNPMPTIAEPKPEIVLEKELSVKDLIIVFEKEDKKAIGEKESALEELALKVGEDVAPTVAEKPKQKMVDKLLGLNRYKKVAPK